MNIKKYVLGALTAFIVIVGMVGLLPHFAHAGNPTANTDSGVAASASSHDQEAAATEQNQESLLKAQPLPSPLSYSLERQNLIDKVNFESKQGTIGYVYLIGPMGQLVAHYTIQGKVSSLNSYLTTTNQVQWGYSGDQGIGGVVLDSPDLDGSYGVNPSGIFFFTTAGQYVEWSGNYLYSNEPMDYTSQPLLLENQPATK